MLNQIKVHNWMTSPVISISPYESITHAHQLMKERGVRRLPVVERESLVGIITIGDVREASPSDATSLSIWELNYLWSQLTVKKIMSQKVITISPDQTIAEAAQMMLDNKVSGLPVVNAQGGLVGMLTESDIFRAVVRSFAAEPSST
jgi:CBS-domain-containing membrane protein